MVGVTVLTGLCIGQLWAAMKDEVCMQAQGASSAMHAGWQDGLDSLPNDEQ